MDPEPGIDQSKIRWARSSKIKKREVNPWDIIGRIIYYIETGTKIHLNPGTVMPSYTCDVIVLDIRLDTW